MGWSYRSCDRVPIAPRCRARVRHRDPVHNYIRVEYQVILDLIDTPEFQHLRRIKQLTGAQNFSRLSGFFFVWNINIVFVFGEFTTCKHGHLQLIDLLGRAADFFCFTHDTNLQFPLIFFYWKRAKITKLTLNLVSGAQIIFHR